MRLNQYEWITASESARVAQTETQHPGRDSTLAEFQRFKGKDPPGLTESFKQLLCSLCHTVPEAELGWVLTQKLHIPQRRKSAALRTSLLLLLLCRCCESWRESMTRTTSLLLTAPSSLWKCRKYLGIFLRHFQQIVVTVGSASTWRQQKRCKYIQHCRKKDAWPR